MCFGSKPPKPQPIKPLPQPVDAAKKAQRGVRKTTAEQTGQFGNIFTTALGDPSYGGAATKQVTLGNA